MVEDLRLGAYYWVHWSGEEFSVRVCAPGVVRDGTWSCTRLDLMTPIVLPLAAFQSAISQPNMTEVDFKVGNKRRAC